MIRSIFSVAEIFYNKSKVLGASNRDKQVSYVHGILGEQREHELIYALVKNKINHISDTPL